MTEAIIAKLLKKKNNLVLYIILIMGIVLMLFSGSKPSAEKAAATDSVSEQEELSRIISGIDGVGRVRVMVTYYGSGTSRIVYDTKTKNGETDRKAVVSGGEAVSSGISFPRVKGVVVVAGGAYDENVKNAITSAVTVALDIPEYKVSVLCGG